VGLTHRQVLAKQGPERVANEVDFIDLSALQNVQQSG